MSGWYFWPFGVCGAFCSVAGSCVEEPVSLFGSKLCPSLGAVTVELHEPCVSMAWQLRHGRPMTDLIQCLGGPKRRLGGSERFQDLRGKDSENEN